MMKTWTVEVRDTDGNDCTVIDFLVNAETQQEAKERVINHCMSKSPRGTEDDGDFGAYYPCDCGVNCEDYECNRHSFKIDAKAHEYEDCSSEQNCDGHGGFSLAETAEEGDKHQTFHSLIDLRTEDL